MINLEFNYIECIISKTDIFKYKQDFIKNLLILLFNLEKELSSFSVEVYFDKIKLSLKMAIKTTNEWKEYNN